MVIKKLQKAHAAPFRGLRLLSFQEAPLAFSESYEDECNKTVEDFEKEINPTGNLSASFVLGIFAKNDDLIGFVKFKKDTRTKAKHKAMIHAFYIAPEHRGKGFGKKLMAALLKKTQRLSGLEQIHLWVLTAHDSALKFYEKCGFVSQGPVVKNDLKINGRYVDAAYMVKNVQPSTDLNNT